jgi:hypothetical protein
LVYCISFIVNKMKGKESKLKLRNKQLNYRNKQQQDQQKQENKKSKRYSTKSHSKTATSSLLNMKQLNNDISKTHPENRSNSKATTVNDNLLLSLNSLMFKNLNQGKF